MKYLYNGHIAPDLPVYDQVEFPYALIVSANEDNTALILMLCVNRPYYGTNPEDSSKKGVYNTGRMQVYTCTNTDDAWIFGFETENPLTANDDDPGGGVIWTRKDILKTDGSVWMAGSEPVPMIVSENWLSSFKMGLALGLVGAPLPYTGKEPEPAPVAYLYGTPSESGNMAISDGDGYVRYNGVVLPPLPEWDKTTYPLAVLGKYHPGGGTYRPMLCYTSLPLSAGSYILMKPDGCIGLTYMYYEDAWKLSENWDDGSPFVLPASPIWANYDVMNYAGTAVSVKASYPVPLASDVPVEVLYGEYALPELPEWDKVTYPYALISEARYDTARLVVYKNAPVLIWSEGAARPRLHTEGVSLHWYCFRNDNAWDTGIRHEYTDIDLVIDGDWTNTDLVNPDGTLYLAASEPAAVYQKKE